LFHYFPFKSIWFDRSDVALPGFAKFFKHNSDEEREHAEKFMKLQNKRGGKVVLQNVQRPDRNEWGTGLDALQTALELEKKVNQSLLNLHGVAGSHDDPYFCDFIESEFLNEQVEAIKDLGDKISELKRAGPAGVGEYLFDQKLQSSSFEAK